jgi:hypothetical protein
MLHKSVLEPRRRSAHYEAGHRSNVDSDVEICTSASDSPSFSRYCCVLVARKAPGGLSDAIKGALAQRYQNDPQGLRQQVRRVARTLSSGRMARQAIGRVRQNEIKFARATGVQIQLRALHAALIDRLPSRVAGELGSLSARPPRK